MHWLSSNPTLNKQGISSLTMLEHVAAKAAARAYTLCDQFPGMQNSPCSLSTSNQRLEIFADTKYGGHDKTWDLASQHVSLRSAHRNRSAQPNRKIDRCTICTRGAFGRRGSLNTERGTTGTAMVCSSFRAGQTLTRTDSRLETRTHQ